MGKILVTGALGQIGQELVPALRERYGGANVIASDIRTPPADEDTAGEPFELLDCTNQQHLEVRHCKSYDCPIWYYRMGRRPKPVDLEKNTGAI